MSHAALGQTTAGRDYRFVTTVFDDEADLRASLVVYPAPTSAEVLGTVVRDFPWEESTLYEAPLSESVVIDTLASVIARTTDRDPDEAAVRAFAAYLAHEPLVAIRRSPISVESLIDLIAKAQQQGTYGVALVVGGLAYYADDPLWIVYFAGAIVLVSLARRAGEAIDNIDTLVRPRLTRALDAPAGLPRPRPDAVRDTVRAAGCPLGVSIRISPNGRGRPGELLRPYSVLDARDPDTCDWVRNAVPDLAHLFHEALVAGWGRNAVIQLYTDGVDSAERLRDELVSAVGASLRVRGGYE